MDDAQEEEKGVSGCVISIAMRMLFSPEPLFICSLFLLFSLKKFNQCDILPSR